MILSFQNNHVRPILRGHKVHTVRRDEKNRWAPLKKIHFYKDNPRNKSKNPYPFAKGVCSQVQKIELDTEARSVSIDGKPLSKKGIKQLAFNDGFINTPAFDADYFFFDFFEKTYKTTKLKGKLIWWKDVVKTDNHFVEPLQPCVSLDFYEQFFM